MKLIAIMIACITLLSCMQKDIKLATLKEQSIKQEVLQSFQRLVNASKDLDTEKYYKIIDHAKFLGLNVNGTNWSSFQELKSAITPGFDSIKTINSLEFPNVKVSVIDHQTAVLVNEYIQSFTLKSGQTLISKGGGTQIWSKSSGKWLLVSISASLKP